MSLHLTIEEFEVVGERVKNGVTVAFEHIEKLFDEVVFHRATLADDPTPVDTFLRWFSSRPLDEQSSMAAFLTQAMAPMVKPVEIPAAPPQPVDQLAPAAPNDEAPATVEGADEAPAEAVAETVSDTTDEPPVA